MYIISEGTNLIKIKILLNLFYIYLSYCRSMKTNLIAFFADLFNVLEIHPAKCVSFNQGINDLADGNITL